MILYWQHLVLGHHQRPEVADHQSVDTQLQTAEDGVGLLWNIRKLNASVEDQFWFTYSYSTLIAYLILRSFQCSC